MSENEADSINKFDPNFVEFASRTAPRYQMDPEKLQRHSKVTGSSNMTSTNVVTLSCLMTLDVPR